MGPFATVCEARWIGRPRFYQAGNVQQYKFYRGMSAVQELAPAMPEAGQGTIPASGANPPSSNTVGSAVDNIATMLFGNENPK